MAVTSDYTVDLILKEQFDTEATYDIKITNNKETPIQLFELDFKSNFEILDLWNGIITKSEGYNYIVKGDYHTQSIPAKSFITLSLRGKKVSENAISNVVLREIKTELEKPFLPSETTAYSRQEWLTELIEVADYTYETTDINSSFVDVSRDNSYSHAIETALMYKIIDKSEQGSSAINGSTVSGAIIRPMELTHREFAIDTALKALRYIDVDTPQKKFKLAESIGLIDSSTNGTTFTTQEARKMLDIVKQIAAPLDFEEGVTESVDILETVKQFATIDLGENGYSFSDNSPAQKEKEQSILTIVKSAKTELLKPGDVILLPANEMYLGGVPQKILEILDSSGENLLFKTTVPNPSELIGEGGFSSKGKTTIDFEKHFTPAPDVKFVSQEGKLLNNSTYASRAVTDTDFGIEITESGVDVSLTKDKATIGAIIDYPKFQHVLEFNSKFEGFGFQIDIARLEMSQKSTFYGKLGDDFSMQPKLLGELNIPIGPSGVVVSGGLYLTMNIEGYLTISFEFNTVAGFEYIKDGGLRPIDTIKPTATISPLEASFKGGIMPSIILKFTIFEIADVGFNGGIGADATITSAPGESDNICTDVTAYAFLDLVGLTDISILGEMLPYDLNISLYDAENSPFKCKWHHEGEFSNRVQVPKCTQGSGSITGKTVDFISGKGLVSTLTATSTISTTPFTLTSSASGIFPSQNIFSTNYQYKIESAGYVTYNGKMTILKDTLTDIGTIKLIKNGNGSVSGTITDALTGGTIADAKLTLLSGSDINASNESSATKVAFTGDTSSSSSGQYNIAISNGYYTLKLEKTGYKTGYINVTSVTDGNKQNVALNPSQDSGNAIGDLRVVLTWGSSPSDLDSHLGGPTASGSRRFHTYYSDKNYSEDGKVHAFLDLDDTSSYGPETTTVYDINTTGKYSFYVHDFTNRSNSSSTALSLSGAKVEVYTKEATTEINPDGTPVFISKLIASYAVPRNKTATLWHVFDYNAATGEIIVRDSMYNESDPGNISGVRSSISEDIDTDIANIMKNLPEKE